MWEVEHVRLGNGTFLVEDQLHKSRAIAQNTETLADKQAVAVGQRVVSAVFPPSSASLKSAYNINRIAKVVSLDSTEDGHRLALYSVVRYSL